MTVHSTKSLRAAILAFAPFSVAALLAWTVVLVGNRVEWTEYALSAGIAVAAAGLAVLAMLRPAQMRFGVVPGALAFLAAVALLRNSVGGTSSGASALCMIPVFHAALYSRSRRQLALVVAGVGVYYLAPILLIGPPAYPQTGYRSAVLAVAVSTIIGFATQRLVASIQHQAVEARRRERMLERLTDVVHGLFDSPEPRADVCRAAREISGATVALVYEPGPDGDLWATAAVGTPPQSSDAGPLVTRSGSAVSAAFRSGRPLLWSSDVASRVQSPEVWAAVGRPEALLFQPLMRQGMSIGVLVVGWSEVVEPGDSRTTVAALLAHEAAAMITRADAMHDLADAAQTDPLTGLPNRRAWDAQLQQALTEHGQLAIAMLDFDYFKEFNDTYGHPAGDRLLKETAAAWREQVRAGDVLARLGGEEFGLILRNCDAQTAVEVTERLRRHVSSGRTCSAGIAVGLPGEDADEVVSRADRALYEAKARGRDRIQLVPVG